MTNQKGGVGKTTTTANLGIGLAQENKRVLLIDADAQGFLTLSLGYPKPDELPVTLADVMQNVIDNTPMPDGYGILHHGEGVDLLPANIDLSGMEIRLINAMSRESVLRTYINAVKPHYDYILIDCMHNELRDTPKTGDDSNPALWFALLGVSAAGAAVLGIVGFRKRRKEGAE